MSARDRQPEVTEMPLADLMVCPWQHEFFRPLSADAKIALAASLAAEGMRTPIDVLPPGNKAGLAGWTILDGMTRRDIRAEQGATVERVCIRWDLADLDEYALKARFVSFNLGRRHLTPLERARIALAQYAAGRRRSAGSLRPSEEREARDRIGKAAGMTGRNLNRYARVLRTPLAVQRCFEDGHLQLVVAEKVADLRPERPGGGRGAAGRTGGPVPGWGRGRRIPAGRGPAPPPKGRRRPRRLRPRAGGGP